MSSCGRRISLFVIGMLSTAAISCGTHRGLPDAGTLDAAMSSTSDGAIDASVPPLHFSDIGQPKSVSDQFYYSEGPVWDPQNGVLYFSDINGHQDAGVGGAIYRLTPPDVIDVLLQPAGNADGLAIDPDGHVIAAGFAGRNVYRVNDGQMQTLAPCDPPDDAITCYQGMQLNTPDDVAVRADGIIYFTDPTFANGAQGFPQLDLPLANAQGVYRLTSDGVLHLEDASALGPNGVNFSPDQKTLYVSYTLGSSVERFDVADDGSLSNKQTFTTSVLAPDSMCVDAGGNVYVGTLIGLSVFDPSGNALGTISFGSIVTNCAFGGSDQKTLYVTTRGPQTSFGAPVASDSSLYEIDDMPVPGVPGQN
ncbi:MAG TPA: SMP-30/gluconolactonase/LRE family protein [Polyangiales bacterium]|nr:SMP-30/gluconolactonase/LRE family protein [Polyangiales bacterium]